MNFFPRAPAQAFAWARVCVLLGGSIGRKTGEAGQILGDAYS